MRRREQVVPVAAAALALVLGTMPVTEHVNRCQPTVPCPSVHTVVVLPERILSGLVLAVLAYAVVSVLVALWRASVRPAPPATATSRAIAALAMTLLAVPASWSIGLLTSLVWTFPPRTTGWANLPAGLLAGLVVGAVLLGCAVAALLTTLRTSAAEPA